MLIKDQKCLYDEDQWKGIEICEQKTWLEWIENLLIREVSAKAETTCGHSVQIDCFQLFGLAFMGESGFDGSQGKEFPGTVVFGLEPQRVKSKPLHSDFVNHLMCWKCRQIRFLLPILPRSIQFIKLKIVWKFEFVNVVEFSNRESHGLLHSCMIEHHGHSINFRVFMFNWNEKLLILVLAKLLYQAHFLDSLR